MKTQISRNSHQRDKQYAGIYQQQGRMLTDADWNEFVEIINQRFSQLATSVIGTGVPKDKGVKLVSDGSKLKIKPGNITIDGETAELVSPKDGSANFAFEEQVNLPGLSKLPTKNVNIYADIWDRTVTALEDENLIDPALFGADTCTREQRMVQIKCCHASIDPMDGNKNPLSGNSLLKAELRKVDVESDPYDSDRFITGAVEKSGNYILRVEVHDVKGDATNPTEITIKWSCENGAENYEILDADNNEIPVPQDFEVGDWVFEHFNDTTEKHLGVHLESSATLSPLRGALKTSVEIDAAKGFNYVRRWDGSCTLVKSGSSWKLKTNGEYPAKDRFATLKESNNESHGSIAISATKATLQLKDHKLELELKNKAFVAGDYWEYVVRDGIDGGILDEDASNGKLPSGIKHNYLLIATIDASGKIKALTDEQKRQLNHPTLTDIQARDIAFENTNAEIFKTSENVQDAIDNAGQGIKQSKQEIQLLKAKTADDIPLKRPDSNLDGVLESSAVKSVQDALIAINNKPSGGGSDFLVTIGEGGKYPDISKAMVASRNESSVWFCFLPGIHKIPKNQRMIFKDSVRLTAVSAASVTLEIDTTMRIQTSEVILENLSFNMKSGEQLWIDSANVSSTGCIYTRKESSKAARPMVMVGEKEADTNIYWENNRMTSSWREAVSNNASAILSVGVKIRGRNYNAIYKDVDDLAKMDPLKEPYAFEKAINETAAKIEALPMTVRKKWKTMTPAASINALPETSEGFRVETRPFTISAARSAVATNAIGLSHLRIERDYMTPKTSVNNFLTLIANERATTATLAAGLKRAVMGVVKTKMGDCLGLASNLVGGTITSSDINGNLVFNAEISPRMDILIRKKILTARQTLKTFVSPGADLSINSCRIFNLKTMVKTTQVSVAGVIKEALPAHNNLSLSDNVIHDEENAVLAGFLTMNSNKFDTAAKPSEQILLPICGYGMFVGNMAVSPYAEVQKKFVKGFKEAANYMAFK